MHAARISIIVTALAAACSSSSSEPQPLGAPRTAAPPDLVASASCSRMEDLLRLSVAVANRGGSIAAGSTTRVEFDGEPASAIVRATRAIAAHSVASFEVEMPANCARAGCRWNVTADSAKRVDESNEANNTFAGRC